MTECVLIAENFLQFTLITIILPVAYRIHTASELNLF